MAHIEGKLDAKDLRVTLVVSRFNEIITGRLLAGAQDCLRRHGADDDAVRVVWVPGSWELPQAAQKIAALGKVDAIVALSALVRGETPHFHFLAAEVSKGLAAVAHDSGLPVIFGVLTTDTVEQALDRAGAKSGNKGWEAALSAIEMVDLFRRLG
jgi:6,7-dimethyl-8-ribityllumazine synthase